MLCFMKTDNIFDRFCKNIYTIEYHKYGLFYINLCYFLYLANQFFEAFYINKITYTKFFVIESDLMREFTRIIT